MRHGYGLRGGIALACAGAAALLAACTKDAAPSAQLFPLEAGHRWTFRQQVQMEDGTSDALWLSFDTLPTDNWGGQTAFRRRSSEGIDYWLRRDATGIYRVASKSELQEEPQKDPTPRYVLKEPLALDTEWQATTVPYLLKRRQGFPPELRHENKAVMMRYAITSLKESVSVPAGSFEDCLKVTGQASLKVYADAIAGWKDLPLVTSEWYCPGPGLVKLERAEIAKSPFLTGGRLSLELHTWQRP